MTRLPSRRPVTRPRCRSSRSWCEAADCSSCTSAASSLTEHGDCRSRARIRTRLGAESACIVSATSSARSSTHLRDLRAPCRHLHLRSVPLHGRKPDHDRPPLRPPRTRRTRTCDPPARRTERWTTATVDAGGRCVDAEARGRLEPGTTQPLAEQEETRSPLTDSNRRPPPYHFGGRGNQRQSTGNGFRLFLPFSRLADLPLIATGCAR